MSSFGPALPHKDAPDELDRERRTLAIAERDIADGTERLRHQRGVVLELRLRGHDLSQAIRLEDALAATLHEWMRHRDVIRERIAHLERTAGMFD